MNPYWQDNLRVLYNKDCRSMIDLPDESVQMVVTSPPYWGLRKYAGLPDLIWGGDEDCEHKWQLREKIVEGGHSGGIATSGIMTPQQAEIRDKGTSGIIQQGFCSLCGAWKGQLGLEPVPSMYINHIVEIFREVKRVLRRDGVAFVNCGDSYYSGNAKPYGTSYKQPQDLKQSGQPFAYQDGEYQEVSSSRISGSDFELMPELSSDLHDPTLVHKVSQPVHFGTLDCEYLKQIRQFVSAIQGQQHSQVHADEQPLVSQVSNGNVSSPVFPRCPLAPTCFDYLSSVVPSLLATYQSEDTMVCPFVSQTITGAFQGYSELQHSNCGNALTGGALDNHKTDKAFGSPSYPYYNIPYHLKAKDLCLIPQHLAIAFQEDSWWVRSVIIWNKTNPMPESVTDRPTESHEYILLLTKSAKYYWDAEAVREPIAYPEPRWGKNPKYDEQQGGLSNYNGGEHTGRNLRSVWTFPTQPYPEAHFATYPEKLVEICIKAATPEVGCCSKCGKPWVRIVKINKTGWHECPKDQARRALNLQSNKSGLHSQYRNETNESIGWQPQCKCNADKIPSIVLDPFAGSGTTLKVAAELNRLAIGYELSEKYCQLIIERNKQQVLM